VAYHYFTTAGFRTPDHEVRRRQDPHPREGVGGRGRNTECGTMQMQPDGSFRVTTEHLKAGNWSRPGHHLP